MMHFKALTCRTLSAALIVFLLHTVALAQISDVSPEEASSLIAASTEQTPLVILDIRTPPEFASGHIEHAKNIDFYSNNFSEQLDALPKDARYLLYCRSGNRSKQALEILRKLKFQHVYHMDSGILGWSKADLPLVR